MLCVSTAVSVYTYVIYVRTVSMCASFCWYDVCMCTSLYWCAHQTGQLLCTCVCILMCLSVEWHTVDILSGAVLILSGAVHNILSGTVLILSGAVHILRGAVHILSGAVHILSGAVHILSGAVHILSGAVHILSGAVHILSGAVCTNFYFPVLFIVMYIATHFAFHVHVSLLLLSWVCIDQLS